MNLLPSRLLGCLSLAGFLWVARADLATFTVDPARSSISLSGSASGAVLTEQAAGSLTTSYTGSLVANVTAGGIVFPGGSVLVARELQSWQPGLNGAAGSASASYGAKGTIGSGLFALNATAASRRMTFDVTSNPLTLTGGAFDSAGLLFRFIDTNNAGLDYRASGILSSSGSKVLSGLATNKVAGVSTLVSAGGVETLTIPVSATYSFSLLLPDDSTITLTGQLVATRGGGIPPPEVVFVPPAPAATDLKLTWSASYKLQRATQLSPPNWADFATDSPITIPFSGPGEFFRVVPK